MWMLNILYNQMEQESHSLILDTDKIRQTYLKGWKCIWVRHLNNKSQFNSFRLRPSFLDCTGPAGRGTPCSQVFGLDQKKSTVLEVRITESFQCSVPALCELDVSPLATGWMFCPARETLSVLKSMGGKGEIIHFATLSKDWGMFLQNSRGTTCTYAEVAQYSSG